MSRVFALMLLSSLASAQVPRLPLPQADAAPSPAPKEIVDLADRIAANGKSVSANLEGQPPSTETLKQQREIKSDLDELIRRLEPPPNPQGGGGQSKNDKNSAVANPPPAGTPPPKSNGNAQSGAAPAKPKVAQPAGAAASKSAGAAGTASRTSLPTLPPEESLARDFWGHLPDSQRARMTEYYKQQAMGKYRELLAEYYKSLAEKDAKGAGK
jgi:hypothetical protein